MDIGRQRPHQALFTPPALWSGWIHSTGLGDVYVSDWVNARDIQRTAGDLHLDDVVLTLQHFMVGLKPAELDVLAVCQATVPALAAAARLVGAGYPEPRSLVLLGGPIDPCCNPTPADPHGWKPASKLARRTGDAYRVLGVPGRGSASLSGRPRLAGKHPKSALARAQCMPAAGTISYASCFRMNRRV